MQKYYLVFDATPYDVFNLSYLRVGMGIEDHGKEAEIGTDLENENMKFFEEYILYIYLAIIVLSLIALVFITYTCISCFKQRKLERMDKTILTMEADKLMKDYKADMDKKNEKGRQKAIERWKKKHPHKPIEDFRSSQMDESSIMDGTMTSFD